jgi:hypothetical protein
MTPIERIAHDIICIVKYGSPGGSAPTSDVKRVADYLERLGQLPTKRVPPPLIVPPRPPVVIPPLRLP